MRTSRCRLGEGDAEAPVEFAPPENVRPGQIGTLIDERANVIDVTATIVDLAGRGFLLIQEIPDRGLFSKTDWNLIRLEKGGERAARRTRQKLLDGLFRDGNEVKVSELKTTFAESTARRRAVASTRMRCARSGSAPDPTRCVRGGRGAACCCSSPAAVLTFVLARWTHWGIVGIPVIVGGRRARADGEADAGADGERDGDGPARSAVSVA